MGAVLHADSEATAMPAYREVPATTADFLPKHTAMRSGSKPWLQNGSGLTLPEQLGGKLRVSCNCGGAQRLIRSCGCAAHAAASVANSAPAHSTLHLPAPIQDCKYSRRRSKRWRPQRRPGRRRRRACGLQSLMDRVPSAPCRRGCAAAFSAHGEIWKRTVVVTRRHRPPWSRELAAFTPHHRFPLRAPRRPTLAGTRHLSSRFRTCSGVEGGGQLSAALTPSWLGYNFARPRANASEFLVSHSQRCLAGGGDRGRAEG